MPVAKPAHPELNPIDSSAIDGWHYDPETRDMHVKFTSGQRVYKVEGVSLERATAFEGSTSPGRYYAKEIAPHHVVSKVA